jgi:hypothetical protein
MTTVTRIEMQFMRNVKSKYLAMRGRTREVGGRILETRRRKTTRERRIDMPRVTFSPVQSERRTINPQDNLCKKLTCFCWQIKDQDTQEGNEQRGKDQIHGVEKSLPPDRNVERDVCFRRSPCLTVVVNIQECGNLHYVPCAALPVVGQVDPRIPQM